MLPRFALPVVHGRGAGLANELFSWAKAYIAAQELNLVPLHPGWGFNKRPYWKYFGTSRADRLAHEALRRSLPNFKFTEEEYLKRRPASFREAVRAFGEENEIEERKAVVLELSGLWGGVPAIAEAKEFIRGQLLTTRHTASNLYEFQQLIDPEKGTVCFHIRRGDFAPDGKMDYAGKFNIAVPIDWFVAVARTIRRATADNYQFVVVGDCTDEDIRGFVAEFPDLIVVRQKNSDISDLICLASADLIVCSISSYSMWGVCLSAPTSRYIWFAPNLVEVNGRYCIWGSQPAQMLPNSETKILLEQLAITQAGEPRGLAVGRSGEVDDKFLEYLNILSRFRNRNTDLLQYGSVSNV
jgi:hypothetical protein